MRSVGCGQARGGIDWHRGGAPRAFVVQGITIHPICWAYGQTINNSYSAVSPGPGYTPQSDVWIQVSDYPSDPWMNKLWFNPDDTAADTIPEC